MPRLETSQAVKIAPEPERRDWIGAATMSSGAGVGSAFHPLYHFVPFAQRQIFAGFQGRRFITR